MDRIVACVPAYNEGKTLGLVLKPLVEARNQEVIDEIVVVDDGSSDSTVEVARVLGVRVLGHGKNMGKAKAFITAFEYALRKDADILFTTDADMFDLTPDKIGVFLHNIRGRDDVWMIRAKYGQPKTQAGYGYGPACQNGAVDDVRFSGFRAVRVKAVDELIKKKPKMRPIIETSGYGIEAALEILIPEGRKIEVAGIPLTSRPAGAGSKTRTQIVSEIEALKEKLGKD